MSSNPIFHAQIKHIELDFHLFREQVGKGLIQIGFISTKIKSVIFSPYRLEFGLFNIFVRSFIFFLTPHQLGGGIAEVNYCCILL